MNFVLKLFKVIIVVIVVLIFGVVVFVSVFNANKYKPEIIAQVEHATGRTFSIKGDIGLTLYPWIGVKLEKVALGNARGFSKRPFAALKQLNIKVNVLPLLKKQVEVSKIQLNGLQLSLEVNKKGHNNWSDLSKNQSGKKPAAATVSPPARAVAAQKTATAEKFALQSLSISGVDFVNASIVFTDKQADRRIDLSDLSLKTGAIAFNKPVEVKLRAHIQNNKPLLNSQITFNTALTFNQDFSFFTLHNLLLRIAVKANDIFAQDVTLKLNTQVSVDVKKQQAKLDRLEINILGIRTKGQFDVTNFIDAPAVSGQVAISPFNLRDVARKLKINLPVMADKNALGKVGLSTYIKMKGQRLDLDNVMIQLDGSQLTGWVHVLDLAKQRLRYALTIDRINVNHYLPSITASATAKPAAATPAAIIPAAGGSATPSSGDEKIPLPLALLRKLDMQGVFIIHALHIKNFDISNLSITTRAKQGIINIDPVTLSTLNGTVDAGVGLNVQKQPQYNLRLQANALQAGPVVNPALVGVMGNEDLKLKGTVNLMVKVTTQGDTPNRLKRQAKGSIELNMSQSAVTGFDPEYFIRSSVADFLKQKGLGSVDTIRNNYRPRKVTVFNTIHDKAIIHQGKITTKDFLMDSQRVTIKAQGEMDIMRNTVDAVASLKLSGNKTVVEKLLNEPVYVHIYGPFEKLKYNLDTKKLSSNLSNLAKKEAQQRLTEEKKKLQQKLKQKEAAEKQRLQKKLDHEKQRLQDKLRNQLKGLF